MKNLWLTEEFSHFFFMLAETFAISSCCVVTYQNITSDTSTITRYENLQETTVVYVNRLRLN